MSTVTYLGHSGFLLEWPRCLWLMDYWKGPLPALPPEKPLLVFASHAHGDHFDPAVFRIPHPDIRYILSDDIALTPAKRRRWGVPEGTELRSIGPGRREIIDCPDGPLTVETLPSTDEGVAFVLTYGGKTVYHAGDLNWWDWPGEGADWNEPMAVNFKATLAPLAGRSIHLAFAPLDPRQEGSYALGLAHLLEIAQVERVFPMHFWDDPTVIPRFCTQYPQYAALVDGLTRPGESRELA